MARISGSQIVDVEVVRRPLWRRLLPPLLLLAILGGAVWYFFIYSPAQRAPEVVAQATDVRSQVSRQGDSLEVEVGWRLKTAVAEIVPESVRVEVGMSDNEQVAVSTQPVDSRLDTLRLSSPQPGQTASGYSCVSGIHRGRIMQETCTPWQFVLPSAEPAQPPRRDSLPRGREPKGRATSKAEKILHIVVQPAGLQVDPDTGGRCAAWQRNNPSRSVWIEVNEKAVADCMGPNGKPTVAQFCAFAILTDGRRVKTSNSTDNPYCDRLFKDWSTERVS
ncbi:MAG: hypothetical protein ACAI18_12935 [Gemmatimonadales bacterium]